MWLLSFLVFEVFDLTTIIKFDLGKDIFQKWLLLNFLLRVTNMH